jgi:hypothetical protein
LAAFARAQGPADIAYLLNDVKEVAPGRFGGALVVFGDRAVPVLNGRSESGGEEPIMAAGRTGDGRIVVFGHTAYLEQELFEVADTAKLMVNAARWAAGEKSSVRVGVYRVEGLAGRLRGLGLDARDIKLDARAGVDVIFLLPRKLTGDELAPLSEYIRRGGGLVAGAVGWMVQAREPDKDLATEFPGNRLTAPAGLVWAAGQVTPALPVGFRAAPLPAALSHAARALDALEEQSARKRTLTGPEAQQISTTLMRAAMSIPPGDTLLRRLQKLVSSANVRAVPSENQPVFRDNLRARLGIALEVNRLRHATPEQVKAHPAAAEFPGSVPQDAPRAAADVPIQTSGWRWGWFGTGLYAAPGEVITVRVPKKAAAHGLSVVIGAHSDKLWNLAEWKRIPEISFQTPIQGTQTRAANAFGGLIYIAVPAGSGVDDFVARIAGGVPTPQYILGDTDLSNWRSSIRKRPAPWAELQSDKIVLTVPSSVVRELDDPAALMQVWNRISDLLSELAGLPNWRARPERMVPDVQISGGSMHAGYPIMMHLVKAKLLVSREALLTCAMGTGLDDKGVFGFYHELGHNVQNDAWVFEGAAEAGVKLFPLYISEQLCGIRVAESPRGSKDFRTQQIARYDFAHPDFVKWQHDDLLGAVLYVQLQQAFGWEAYKRVFATYLALPEGKQPKDDGERRDQWLVRFSRQVRRNLGPFFQAWGIPTSEAARASIADLPAWMPDELPNPERGSPSWK